jgi:hypothetical protein
LPEPLGVACISARRRFHTDSASRSLTLKVTYIGSSGGHRGEQGGVAALSDQSAHPDLGAAHAAVQRRLDGGVAELEPDAVGRGLIGAHGRPRVLDGRPRRGQPRPRVLQRGAVGLHGGLERGQIVRIWSYCSLATNSFWTSV